MPWDMLPMAASKRVIWAASSSSRCCRRVFCSIRRAFIRSRSVMSCSVTTQPPSARGWIETDSTRPSPGWLMRWLALLRATRSRMTPSTSSAFRPGIEALGDAILDQLAQWRARPQMLRLEAVDLRIAIVGEDQTLLGVEHGKALRHVRERHVEIGVLHLELGQRHVEAGIAGLQLGLALLQQHVLLGEALA